MSRHDETTRIIKAIALAANAITMSVGIPHVESLSPDELIEYQNALKELIVVVSKQ